MQKRIIVATANQGKLREIKAIFADLNMTVVSMREAGFEQEIEESGTTFEENAVLKARAVWNHTGGIVLSDDSGLEIDYLNGAPGVYSSRYLGEDTPYEIKNRQIIKRLEDVEGRRRSARFISVIAAVLPDGTVKCADGIVEGLIADVPAGIEGFGYDPIFYLPEFGKTAAEISLAEKNKISHRGKALEKMRRILIEVCKGENE